MNINHFVIIIDISFSMIKYKKEVIFSFNKFITKQKQQNNKNPVIIIFINNKIKVIKYKTVQEVPLLTSKNYIPNNTSDLSSILKILNEFVDMSDMCLIITDGYHNFQSISKENIVNKMKELKNKKKCKFLFYGSLFENIKINNYKYTDLTHLLK